MDKKELHEVIEDAVNDSELKSSEIPSIDLYVDQIINLVSEKQKEGSPRFLDRQLTKTMINNYSKDGVISPVKGKKYTKEQILQILSVYTLKNTLSISEIKRILSGAYSLDGFNGEDLNGIYDDYLKVKEANRKEVGKIMDSIIESNGLDIENDRDFITVIGGAVSLSAFFKHVAQGMIDARFPENKENEEKDADADDVSTEEDKKKKKEKKKNKKTPDAQE